MRYETFPQFKGRIQDAGFKGTDAQCDILFAYYTHARRQASLILGRLTPQGYNDEMSKKQGQKWSIWLNDSFILGGIHSRIRFYLKSSPDALDYVDPKNQHVFNVTQRELIGLTTFGYSRSTGTDPKGLAYTCTSTPLADAATFKAYADQVQALASAAK